MPGAPTIPVIDDRLTMAPPPAARISGMTARAQIQALPTLTRMTRSSSCTGDSASVPNDDVAALFTSTVGEPYACTVRSTIVATSSSRDASPTTPNAAPPSRAISPATASAADGVEVDDGHTGALASEADGRGTADARPATGHDRDLTGQPH